MKKQKADTTKKMTKCETKITRMGRKIHPMTTYLFSVYFLTNGIQTLQHLWKKILDYKGNYVKKFTSFGHILW